MKLNCLIVDDESISRKFLEHYIKEAGNLLLVKSCSSIAEAEMSMQKSHIDLIFLDIEMPGKSGLDFLHENEIKPLIILVTAKREYAVQAFEYDVVDYLVKPISFPRFMKAVEKTRKVLNASVEKLKKTSLSIKVSSNLVNIRFDEILYIEARGDYIQFVTKEKKYLTYGTMTGIFGKLPEKDFSRVHRSFIVRHDAISVIQDNNIILASVTIPIGVSYRKKFLKAVKQY
jgi:two-component system, LytTR family, response regulator